MSIENHNIFEKFCDCSKYWELMALIVSWSVYIAVERKSEKKNIDFCYYILKYPNIEHKTLENNKYACIAKFKPLSI